MVKKKWNVRKMRQRIASCVYYTLYIYTHVHCICTAGGQGIFFPTGKSILPTRLLFQHLLGFAQHHQVGICDVNHPISEKEVLCCCNEPSQVSSVTSLFAFSLRPTHRVSITWDHDYAKRKATQEKYGTWHKTCNSIQLSSFHCNNATHGNP